MVYEPQFALNAAQDSYTSAANETGPSRLDAPLPVGISFWAGPGDEPVLSVAASYGRGHQAPAAPAGVRPGSYCSLRVRPVERSR